MKDYILWFSVYISCGLAVINATTVPLRVVACPEGFHWNNGQCVSITDGSNTKIVDPAVCLPGFTMIGERCVQLVNPTSPPIIQPAVCHQGSILSGGQCIPVGGTGIQTIQPTICHQGSVMSGGQCVQVGGTTSQFVQPAICHHGSVMSGGQCIQPTMCQQPPVCQQSVCAQQQIQQIPCAPSYQPYIIPMPIPNPIPIYPPAPHPIPEAIKETKIIYIYGSNSSSYRTLEGEGDVDVSLTLTNVINVNNSIHAPVNVTNHNIVNTPVHLSESSSVFGRSEVRPVTPYPSPRPSPSSKCCSVISPRICRTENNQWQCSHKKYHRCGSFCVAPKIYLRTHAMRFRDSRLIVPPIRTNPYYRQRGTLDCSGCMSRQTHHCSQGCYTYDCNRSRGCQYQDQEEFCSEYGGEGCNGEDGYEEPNNSSYEDLNYTIN